MCVSGGLFFCCFGRRTGAEALAELGLVDDDDELLRHHLHHLLAEESAAAALDQSQVGVDLVCAVDGDVEVGLLVEGAQRDAEALSLVCGWVCVEGVWCAIRC